MRSEALARRIGRCAIVVAAGLLWTGAGPAVATIVIGNTTIVPKEGPFAGAITTFTDSVTSRMPSDYTASILWSDDGTTSAGAITGANGRFTIAASRTFADEGFIEATVTVTVNATQETQTQVVGVAVQDTDVITGTPVQLLETQGVSFTAVVGTFSDANTVTQASDLGAEIQWGDGTFSLYPSITGGSGSFNVVGTHTYTQFGRFYLFVSLADLIQDPDTGPIMVTSVVDVRFPPSPGVVHFNSAAYATVEGAGGAVITVVRDGGSTGPVRVSYAAANGTGVAGRDFTPVSGTLSWADGDQAPKTFMVPVLPTSELASKTVELTLSNLVGGAALGAPSTALLTIADGTCVPSDTVLCLGGGRFRAQAAWQAAGPSGGAGSGHVLAPTDTTGFFWFFDANDVELIVKVVDGCAVNGHLWVFAAGLTDAGVALTVDDTSSGESNTYNSSPGTAYQPVQDVNAFSACQ